MLLLITLSFSLLALVNYRLGGKALLYPPVVFCAIWAFDLFLVWVAGDFFYAMLPQTLFIFLMGAILFSLGSWMAVLVPGSKPPAEPSYYKNSDRIITLFVLIAAGGTPLFFRWIFGLVSASGGTGPFLMFARQGVMEEMGKSLAFTLFGTLNDFSHLIAMIAFYERERHPKRAVIAILASLSIGVLLGQKVGPLSLAIGLVCIEWVRTRRINWRVVIAMLFVFVAVTATIELSMHIGSDSFYEKIVTVYQNTALYASGGMIGFDRLIREPNIVPAINPLYVIYLRIHRRLGGYAQIPEVADFVAIGPNTVADNVYTMYGEYLFLGYFGAILFTGLIGFVLTMIYQRALQGGKICILLYAVLFRGVVFGAFKDYFLTPYFLFEVCVLAWFIYSFPVHWAKFKTLIGRAVESHLVKGQ